jgi:hypothetical protein
VDAVLTLVAVFVTAAIVNHVEVHGFPWHYVVRGCPVVI